MKNTKKVILASALLFTSLNHSNTIEAATPKFIKYSATNANSVSNIKAAINKTPDDLLYKVRKNDTVVNLAKATGVSVTDFAKANEIKDVKKVPVGDVVIAKKALVYDELNKPFTETSYKEIPYRIKINLTESISPGRSKITQKGVKGKEKVITTYKMIDGQKVALSSKSEIVSQPSNELIDYGKSLRPPIRMISRMETMPFNKVSVEDKNLEEGKSYVKQKGEEGYKHVNYTTYILDFMEYGQEDYYEEISKKPVDEITVYGTKKPVVKPIPNSDLLGGVGYNAKYRDGRYESNTSATHQGYKVGQTTWTGYKVARIYDRLNTTIEDILNMPEPEKVKRANNKEYQNLLILSKDGKEYISAIKPNYKTQKAFNEGNLINFNRMNEKFLKLINAERAKKGVSPLVIDKELAKGNDLRAQEMADLGTIRINGIKHTRPDKSSFNTAFKYLPDYELMNENTFWSSFDGNYYMLLSEDYLVDYTFNSWLNSPGHYRTMVNPDYTKIYYSIKISEIAENNLNDISIVANTAFRK